MTLADQLGTITVKRDGRSDWSCEIEGQSPITPPHDPRARVYLSFLAYISTLEVMRQSSRAAE